MKTHISRKHHANFHKIDDNKRRQNEKKKGKKIISLRETFFSQYFLRLACVASVTAAIYLIPFWCCDIRLPFIADHKFSYVCAYGCVGARVYVCVSIPFYLSLSTHLLASIVFFFLCNAHKR